MSTRSILTSRSFQAGLARKPRALFPISQHCLQLHIPRLQSTSPTQLAYAHRVWEGAAAIRPDGLSARAHNTTFLRCCRLGLTQPVSVIGLARLECAMACAAQLRNQSSSLQPRHAPYRGRSTEIRPKDSGAIPDAFAPFAPSREPPRRSVQRAMAQHRIPSRSSRLRVSRSGDLSKGRWRNTKSLRAFA